MKEGEKEKLESRIKDLERAALRVIESFGDFSWEDEKVVNGVQVNGYWVPAAVMIDTDVVAELESVLRYKKSYYSNLPRIETGGTVEKNRPIERVELRTTGRRKRRVRENR